jgi:hypothetical protein
MSLMTAEEGASSSLPELPPRRKAVRDTKFFEKFCWLLVPILVIVVTLFFLPSHLRPNLVSLNLERWYCITRIFQSECSVLVTCEKCYSRFPIFTKPWNIVR